MAACILLIDDDESLRRVTEYNLSESGFDVITAGSGQQGLELFSTHNPDLVITDVKLGDMDGLEVLGVIKRKSPETPVIVITALAPLKWRSKPCMKVPLILLPSLLTETLCGFPAARPLSSPPCGHKNSSWLMR